VCIGDIQLGQYIKSETSIHTTASGASAEIVPRRRNRVGIYFAQGGTLNVTVSPTLEPTSQGRGFPVRSGTGDQRFTLMNDGDLPQQQWWSYAGTSGAMLIVEFFVPAEVLQRIYTDIGLPAPK